MFTQAVATHISCDPTALFVTNKLRFYWTLNATALVKTRARYLTGTQKVEKQDPKREKATLLSAIGPLVRY